MSIANELSCDVAAAVLTNKDSNSVANNMALTKLVLEVHTTLQRLTSEEKLKRRSNLLAPPTPNNPTSNNLTKSTASSNH